MINRVRLDPGKKINEVAGFANQLKNKIIGQSRAVGYMIDSYQTFQSGLSDPEKPISVMMFMGPTGVGKTKIVEAAAEIVYETSKAVVKIDCGEFQKSHEIAKLIGSPAGYVGHTDTPPIFSQSNIDKFNKKQNKPNFLLLDEVEKASPALWNLILGLLDKGFITNGLNQVVDFTRTIIVMTSNLGAKEMSDNISSKIGFAGPKTGTVKQRSEDLDQKLYHTATNALQKRFAPEFINRLDHIAVFHSLTEDDLKSIMRIELKKVQRRITNQGKRNFSFRLTDEVERFLLEEGYEPRFGARHIKRVINREITQKLGAILASNQIQQGDVIHVEMDQKERSLVFDREHQGLLVHSYAE